MFALNGTARRLLPGVYMAACETLAYCLLRGRAGKRDFRRVIIVAPLGRNNGISSGALLQCAALHQIGVEVQLLDATPALRNPFFRIKHQPGSAYVFHAAGPQTANLISSVLPHAARAYRVGYWAWELPDPPLDWSKCDRNLDEIWTPSSFSQASLARLVNRPIEIVPHYISKCTTRQPRVDKPFTVLVMADSRSSWSRKNPEGALRAFHAAFGTSPAARLILKLNGHSKESHVLEESLRNLVPFNNVDIVRGHLDSRALIALYHDSDVLLSLHRSEGYGLPMNEAMAHGLPVVATGWSGNIDFMSASDSYLIPYKLVPVNDMSGIYVGSTWAEPDLDAAAQALRLLAFDPVLYARLAAAAHRRASAATPRFPFVVRQDTDQLMRS